MQSAFNFLAYIAEHNPCTITSNRDGTMYHIEDDESFVFAVKNFNEDVRTEVQQHKGEQNESGMVFVKLDGIKFHLWYHDQEEKEKIFYLLNQ